MLTACDVCGRRRHHTMMHANAHTVLKLGISSVEVLSGGVNLKNACQETNDVTAEVICSMFGASSSSLAP